MTDTVRVDPTELARVSQSYLDVSQKMFAALRLFRASALVAPADFGSVGEGDGLTRVHEEELGLAGSLFERYIAVLEVDADNLLRLAFAYQQADQEAARLFRDIGP